MGYTSSSSPAPSPSRAPADLILVGHGSRDPGAGEVLGGLRDAVAARLAPAQVTLAWIELDAPLVADLVADPQARPGTHQPAERPAIVVPLLLSRGTHVVRDLPPTAAAPLGPDPLLTRILLDRIAEAGIAAGRPLVLAATGTSHPEGVSDVAAQAAMLEAAWGAPVRAGFVTAEPSLTSAAAAASAASASPGTKAAIVSYFLAPGRISDGAGADTAHLGDHPALVELVLARYRGAAPVGVTQMGL